MAATLGKWVPQDWTATDIAHRVDQYRGVDRPWPKNVANPAGYLRTLLVAVTPAGQRLDVMDAAAGLREHQEAIRVAHDSRIATAVPVGQRSAEGLFAQLRAKLTKDSETSDNAGDEDWPEVRQFGTLPQASR